MQPPRGNPYEAPQHGSSLPASQQVVASSSSHIPQNICHRRSTVTQGLTLLFSLALLDAIFVLVLVVLMPLKWPDDWWGIVFSSTILTFVNAVGLWIGVQMIRARDVFECHLTERELSCVSPLTAAEANFTIAVTDIVKIEKISDDDSRRWYLWTKQGQRYWLTENYGNPVLDIVEELEERLQLKAVEIRK